MKLDNEKLLKNVRLNLKKQNEASREMQVGIKQNTKECYEQIEYEPPALFLTFSMITRSCGKLWHPDSKLPAIHTNKQKCVIIMQNLLLFDQTLKTLS